MLKGLHLRELSLGGVLTDGREFSARPRGPVFPSGNRLARRPASHRPGPRKVGKSSHSVSGQKDRDGDHPRDSAAGRRFVGLQEGPGGERSSRGRRGRVCRHGKYRGPRQTVVPTGHHTCPRRHCLPGRHLYLGSQAPAPRGGGAGAEHHQSVPGGGGPCCSPADALSRSRLRRGTHVLPSEPPPSQATGTLCSGRSTERGRNHGPRRGAPGCAEEAGGSQGSRLEFCSADVPFSTQTFGFSPSDGDPECSRAEGEGSPPAPPKLSVREDRRGAGERGRRGVAGIRKG